LTTSSVATDGLGATANTRVRTTFDAVQLGLDTGRLNWGGTGWNAHFGVLGGGVHANADEQFSGSNVKLDATFAGVYGVLVNGPMFLNATARYDWLSGQVTDAAAGFMGSSLDGQSVNVTANAGYHYQLFSQWFVEPTVGVNWTQTNLGSLSTTGGSGALSFGTLDSVLAHAGARVGTTFQVSNGLILQPFGTIGVWHEFGDDFNATFASGGVADSLSLARVGTFYQGGGGVAFQMPGSNFTGFARVDVDWGDKLNGQSLVGGLRYNFKP